jgi:hypothetical protein
MIVVSVGLGTEEVQAVSAVGYTVVVCTADGCRTPLSERLLSELRPVVGASRFGILVVSGCTLGGVACRLRAPGPLIAVQPCDVQRNPVGPTIRVGPLRTGDDIAALVRWLRRGRFAAEDLPGHMVATQRAIGAAAAN